MDPLRFAGAPAGARAESRKWEAGTGSAGEPAPQCQGTHFLESHTSGANILFRGLMEVANIGASTYAAGNTDIARALPAVGAPDVGFGFRGFMDFRQAGSAVEWLRLVQELPVSGLVVARCSSRVKQPWASRWPSSRWSTTPSSTVSAKPC
jgi:hypothetical protein